jgi:hypothetical protein
MTAFLLCEFFGVVVRRPEVDGYQMPPSMIDDDSGGGLFFPRSQVVLGNVLVFAKLYFAHRGCSLDQSGTPPGATYFAL